MGSAYRTVSELPQVTGPAQSTSKVAVFSLDSGTESDLVAAFDAYEAFPSTCTSETIPGTVHLATVKASGVSFAVAGFRPAPGCHETDIDGQTTSGNMFGPFGIVPPPPAGLFERHGGRWAMNVETGKPFPCPPYPADQGPGLGSPVVPLDVLAAWRMPYYSPTCITTTPQQPR